MKKSMGIDMPMVFNGMIYLVNLNCRYKMGCQNIMRNKSRIHDDVECISENKKKLEMLKI